jgi:hypothetical protein
MILKKIKNYLFNSKNISLLNCLNYKLIVWSNGISFAD